ncbi:putative histone-lysine nh3 lysine-79 specific [Phaeomoniella chlamydospora]|uniref:Histone-lysine N-methyltransferase, H3 lysine-79 specific n=1 Tax=Phaeomoniella chlamydospora TaxID=158046 RepID=A0A0G2F0P0_PHACM|nr:putative histone-lysine nh3 lysine-79 specific [Phaeomoniella chlamydospora]
MPTANSTNKPRATMPMGMVPVDPKKFRVETVVRKPQPLGNGRPSPVTKSANSRQGSGTSTPARGLNGNKVAPRRPSPAPVSHLKRKDATSSARSSASKRSSPAVRTPTTPLFDDDDSDSTDEDIATKKRKLEGTTNLDTTRIIYLDEAFKGDVDPTLEIVQAGDIAHEGAVEKKSAHYTNFFTTEIEDGVALDHFVNLRYPSSYQTEKYHLVAPKEHDDFKPMDEMIRVITTAANYYLDGSDAKYIADEASGLVLQLRRAIKKDNLSGFHDLINRYNTFLEKRIRDGSITKVLSARNSPLPLPWVEQLLNQTYSRTVSLHVQSLRQYENGTDNVYGELLPRFISNIFRETRLTSSQVFVDLGSGVGNVVLQAALEIGCESWGCEMMPNACDLATLQHKEFVSRCKLWGLKAGPVHLENGDFLANIPTLSALKRADVVLVNNQAFTPALNDKLIMHFLDLKEGCKIVSLKSFVPRGHKIQSWNIDSPVNVLKDRELRYFSDSVSWTDAPGTYHIAIKDKRALEEFIKRGRDSGELSNM